MNVESARLPVQKNTGLPEAEAALVGSMLLLGRDAVAEVVAALHDDDLTDPRHRVVLQAVRGVLADDGRPDPVTVLGWLARKGRLAEAMTDDRGAGTFVADLLAAVPVPESAAYYRRIVVEHAARRRLSEAAVRLSDEAARMGLDELHALLLAEVAAVVAVLRRAGVAA